MHMHKKPHRSTHVCMQLCRVDEIDVGSQLDMYTVTDVCLHSCQQMGRSGITETCKLDHIVAHTYAKGMKLTWESDRHVSCNDACKHSNCTFFFEKKGII